MHLINAALASLGSNLAPSLKVPQSRVPEHRPSVRIARTRDERESAFRILYRTYVRAQLMEPNQHGLRVTPYHLLPSTNVFISQVDNETVATVSLVKDSPLGLPIESLYPEQVAQLRGSGARIAEFCCLADRRSEVERGLEGVIQLTRLAFQFALRERLDYLLLVAHPRHARFYKRAMGMKTIGEVKSCPYVRNRPAEPLILEMENIENSTARLRDAYFGEIIPQAELLPAPISYEDIAYFAQFIQDDDPAEYAVDQLLELA